jgi:hypothetical protein
LLQQRPGKRQLSGPGVAFSQNDFGNLPLFPAFLQG